MNQLVTLNKTEALIQRLLDNDPRLISAHTTRQYKSDLLDFERWRAGKPITKTLVEAYASHLIQEGYSVRTINQHLAAIRWYARKVSDLITEAGGDETAAKHAARVATVRDVKGDTPERGRHIEHGELEALLRTCLKDKSPAGLRDAAIFALAWMTGLRREEIASIELEHLRNDTGTTVDIEVIGKGRKVRTVYLDDGAYNAVMDWMRLRGDTPGRLFVSVTKGGRVKTFGRLSGEALRKILDKRCLEAALANPITWHDFRRTFAGNLWDAGVDGVVIQKLMGHASQNQTAKYDRRPEETRRKAIKQLHVPYRRKEFA